MPTKDLYILLNVYFHNEIKLPACVFSPQEKECVNCAFCE